MKHLFSYIGNNTKIRNIAIVLMVFFTGCCTVRESTTKETITKDTTLTIPVPNTNDTLQVKSGYGFIEQVPSQDTTTQLWKVKTDKEGNIEFKGKYKDHETKVKINTKTNTAVVEGKHDPLKVQVTTSTTNISKKIIQERTWYQKIFDGVKSFVFYIVVVLVLVVGVIYFVRFRK